MFEVITSLWYSLINIIRHGCTHNNRRSIPVNGVQTCLDCGAWREYQLPALTNRWSKKTSGFVRTIPLKEAASKH